MIMGENYLIHELLRVVFRIQIYNIYVILQAASVRVQEFGRSSNIH